MVSFYVVCYGISIILSFGFLYVWYSIVNDPFASVAICIASLLLSRGLGYLSMILFVPTFQYFIIIEDTLMRYVFTFLAFTIHVMVLLLSWKYVKSKAERANRRRW